MCAIQNIQKTKSQAWKSQQRSETKNIPEKKQSKKIVRLQ